MRAFVFLEVHLVKEGSGNLKQKLWQALMAGFFDDCQ